MNLTDARTVREVAKVLGLTPEHTLTLARSYGLLRRKFGATYILTPDDIEILRQRPTRASRRSRSYDRYGSPPEAPIESEIYEGEEK